MFTDKEKSDFFTWRTAVKTYKWSKNEHSGKSCREIFIEQTPCPIKYKIEAIYNEGTGFKILARELDITNSVCRKLLIDYLHLACRTGQNVVTDKLRARRKINATGEKSNFYDWPNRKPQLQANTTRSVQGYYKDVGGRYVWLRSTYEYIYAKWLDSHKILWKTEVQRYALPNGENYRPDFFIYNAEGILTSIVEIKSSYFNNRPHKIELLKEVLDKTIELSIVYDITKFTTRTYHQELKQWKKERLSKAELPLKE